MWRYRGQQRPRFADPPGPGQESVWDYPRPPAVEPDGRLVEVRHGDVLIASTRRAVRVLETASPPTFYLPADDVDTAALVDAAGDSTCEWKGRARYFGLVADPAPGFVAWAYERPTPRFAALRGHLSFYPGRVACHVAGERVRAQPGGFYGGWMTGDIAGPVKGEPGTGHW